MFLIPYPKKIEMREGMLTFDAKSNTPPVKAKISKELCEKESYRLTVSASGVTIEGADKAGVYYGRLTLKQILYNYRGCLPYMYISDEPKYGYRGFMIDSCRHFFTVDEIKKMVDGAALFKFNKFHFHLSDDQGFRVEIKSYPLLTTVASKRKASEFGRGENDQNEYAHYYTKAELKEIVDYCTERFIEVIPEFDFPGHTSAVLSAYPELSCKGGEVEVKTTAGIFNDILCAGNPDTYKMIYSVIDELCEIFPGKYFHIGGDEAPKVRWEACEKCAAEKERLGLSNMEQLQGYMTNAAASYLKKKGKKAICWNESLKGKNLDNDNITVALWMDKTDNTVNWANAGGPVIVESFTPYYADYPYGMHPLSAVYNYKPEKIKGLTKVGISSIKGVETPIWTEYVTSFKKMSYMCFPRWLAVADTAWNGTENKEIKTFLQNVEFYCDILKEIGHFPASNKEWNVLPHERLSETLGFFKNSLTKNIIAQFIKGNKG